MKAIGKKILFLLLYYSGVTMLQRYLFQKRSVTIFILHNLSDTHFSSIVNALKKKYSFISMDMFINLKQKGEWHKLPNYPAILTFDDGHKNNFSLLNTIEENKIPTTFFVCSEIINTNRHFWSNYPIQKSKLEDLKKLPNNDMLKSLSLYGYFKEKEYNSRQALNLREINAMQDSGFAFFESHTCYHPILTMLDENESRFEIQASKNSLEKLLNKKITGFAYPNGDYGDREKTFVKESGYTYAVTVDSGFNSEETDNFSLKRICLNDEGSIIENIVKASGIWKHIKNP